MSPLVVKQKRWSGENGYLLGIRITILSLPTDSVNNFVDSAGGNE